MKQIMCSLFGVFLTSGLLCQNLKPIMFSCSYCSRDSIDVELKVKNISHKVYFYKIGAQALTDTGWVSILGDVNSLGQNEFMVLKQLKPRAIVHQKLSMKRLVFIYSYRHPRQIRFKVDYYEKKDFDSDRQTIYANPMAFKKNLDQ